MIVYIVVKNSIGIVIISTEAPASVMTTFAGV